MERRKLSYIHYVIRQRVNGAFVNQRLSLNRRIVQHRFWQGLGGRNVARTYASVSKRPPAPELDLAGRLEPYRDPVMARRAISSSTAHLVSVHTGQSYHIEPLLGGTTMGDLRLHLLDLLRDGLYRPVLVCGS